MKSNPHLSRPAALMEITSRAVLATREGVVGFADRVAEIYLATVPAAYQRVPFRPMVGDIAQITAAQKANRQTVDRYIKGVVLTFPSDLEDAWVAALPGEFQEEALGMLASRHGLLATRARGAHEGLAAFSDTLAATAAYAESMAPIVADGTIDERDLPFIKPALLRINTLQASLAGVEAQLIAALPDEQAGNVVPIRNAG
ncbi:hypothetical protein L2Y94_05600 [Luteibacter aegosomatis]|uniref:hypothetical protein n=1 Tax=Luteibacter aegosomatis TaxID=2911537 RepID=UPI001FF752F1|nr:hypothetical protein [Luteibacter aegosomatis]UPG86829.1 hypothetical protein L2Y94_05600 [Luteibacter aegosomatis]